MQTPTEDFFTRAHPISKGTTNANEQLLGSHIQQEINHDYYKYQNHSME